jgi:hypothetical protein
MSGIRIETVAIGKDKIYSVGAVTVSEKGDVYVISKFKNNDFHTSRHSSGETHWKSEKRGVFHKLRDGKPIENLEEIEFLGTDAFGLESLPLLYREYKMKKSDGIFVVDLRDYSKAAFNMSIAILTNDGLPTLFDFANNVYSACHPMIAIMVFDAKREEKKE